MSKIAVFLFNVTNNAPEPFAKAGWEVHCYDIGAQNKAIQMGNGSIHYHEMDMRLWTPEPFLSNGIDFFGAFPPCTDVAVSGSRWMRQKGLRRLANAIDLFGISVQWAEWFGAPYFIENPVGVISSHYRKPDHYFHPWQYTSFCRGDNYTKKTCIWSGNGFVMPEPNFIEGLEIDDRIHKQPPSAERSAIRSETPSGFMRAVYAANFASPQAIAAE